MLNVISTTFRDKYKILNIQENASTFIFYFLLQSEKKNITGNAQSAFQASLLNEKNKNETIFTHYVKHCIDKTKQKV